MKKLFYTLTLLSPLAFVSCAPQVVTTQSPVGKWQGQQNNSTLRVDIKPDGKVKLQHGSAVAYGSWVKNTPSKLLVSSNSSRGFQFKGNFAMVSDNLATLTYNRSRVSMVRVITQYVSRPKPKPKKTPEAPRVKQYRLNSL